MGGPQMGQQMANPTGNVLLPDFSSFNGTPSYLVNMKVQSNVPGFVADNELKMEILKRQLICHAQVRASLAD